MSESTFESACNHARETALLKSVGDVLQWDERTKMPPAAGGYRAEQITCLSTLVHRRQTDPQLGEWLSELRESPLAGDPHSDTGATIRELGRAYDKMVKLPTDLVEALTRASILGQQAWAAARQSDDFAAFEPHLAEIVRLKQRQAEAVGYDKAPYDALLDDFEPQATTAEVAQVLEALRRELVPLVAEIADSDQSPDREVVRAKFPVSDQASFGVAVANAIGFDFTRGRLDVTNHPFCSGLGPDDCRITTRYDKHYFPGAFFGILHEAGHGLYEQGLRGDQFGLPPGTYVSLGIHESQSRMWENSVGRSRAFWEHFFPRAQRAFPKALGEVELDQFWFAVNDVRPSLIRVEADEATYNLHIIIRFELEQALLSGDLQVCDLPAAWSDKYQENLGISPPNDADGVLQDIHWSAGLFGYFPTYALGNLYAAQLFDSAEEAVGPLADHFRNGNFAPLLDWLRTNIHHPGMCFPARNLVENVTGHKLSHESLLRSLRGKYHVLYGISDS